MKTYIHDAWKGDTLEALSRFISIPAKSKDFDDQWQEHGFLHRSLEEGKSWAQKHFPSGTFEIIQLPGIPPVLFFDIPATGGHTGKPVLFYGHFDKQPETSGWDEGLGPWTPVVKNGRLYGRGAVDDGYCFYSTLTAVKALEVSGKSHPRICGLFETDEESGSTDLAQYINMLKDRVGSPAFICILDLFATDFSRVWITQSLRGIVGLIVKVSVLSAPSHSGVASGIVPSSFRIMRALLDRLEDSRTGEVLIKSMHSPIPGYILDMAKDISAEYDPRTGFKYHAGTQSAQPDAYTALIAGTWKPTLSVLGADGLPPTATASGLVRSSTSLKLSFRIPPGVNARAALDDTIRALTTDVPYNATVEISQASASEGFCAPEWPQWLRQSSEKITRNLFGTSVGSVLCGASIGTLPAFQAAFPGAPFINTGALGPDSGAHAANEWLDLAYVEKLTEWVAEVVGSIPEN